MPSIPKCLFNRVGNIQIRKSIDPNVLVTYLFFDGSFILLIINTYGITPIRALIYAKEFIPYRLSRRALEKQRPLTEGPGRRRFILLRVHLILYDPIHVSIYWTRLRIAPGDCSRYHCLVVTITIADIGPRHVHERFVVSLKRGFRKCSREVLHGSDIVSTVASRIHAISAFSVRVTICVTIHAKIRHCFFSADKSKMVNYISASAQHIEAPIKTNNKLADS
jgi:hypothetical protein